MLLCAVHMLQLISRGNRQLSEIKVSLRQSQVIIQLSKISNLIFVVNLIHGWLVQSLTIIFSRSLTVKAGYKPVSLKHGLRNTECRLDIKYELGIKR